MIKKLIIILVLIAWPMMDALAISRCSFRLNEHIDNSNSNWGKTLNLDRCSLHQEDVPYIVTFLQNETQPKVRTLVVEVNSIDDTGMTMLANALAAFHLLDANAQIFSMHNDLTDVSAHALAQIQELTRLDLFDNHITSVGAADLAKSPIRTLYIAYNPLGEDGAIALGKSNSLYELDIRYAGIGSHGAAGLAKSNSLNTIYLDNNNIGDAGAAAFAQNISVKHLILNQNNIGADGAIGLAKNTSLDALTLIDNHIGDTGAVALATNTHMNFINLNLNDIGDEGAIALAKNTTIKSLYLIGNDITDSGARALANVVHLDTLRISENKIGSSGKDALQQAFMEKRIGELDD